MTMTTIKTDMMMPMMNLTMLPSLQKGRTMSATTINQ